MDLSVLANAHLLVWTVVIICAASASKILGCFAGARLAGLDSHDAFAVGIATNARGAMGLVVGIIGFSLGILTLDLFSIVVVLAIVTTALAPPFLKQYMAKHPAEAAPREVPALVEQS